MTFTAQYSSAHRMVSGKGSSVTFAYTTETYTAATDTAVTTSATMDGVAVRVRGNPKQYEALSLVESEAPTLLVVLDEYGDLPSLGSSVTWGGVAYTVRAINPVDPDGNGAIVAKMVVAR